MQHEIDITSVKGIIGRFRSWHSFLNDRTVTKAPCMSVKPIMVVVSRGS